MDISPIFLTITVLIVALIAFIAEWLPVDLTSLSVAVVLMLLGLVSPSEGISGFGNSATITVMAMFILSAGLTKTGILNTVRDWLIKFGGKNPSQQIFTLGMIIGPISAFINNTAVVAIFLPIVEQWSKQTKISVSKLLIPMSFLTILGGLITLLGTSTNILASGIAVQLGYKEFSIFQFTALGIPVFLIGLIYISLAAPKILPSRKPAGGESFSEDYELKEYVSEMIIPPKSSLIGQTLRSSEIQRKFDLDILEIIRNDEHFPPPLADKVLALGDILLVRGSRNNLLNIKDERGVEILADFKFNSTNLEKENNNEEEKIAEVLILSNSRLIGATLKDLRFRQRYNCTVLAIRRGQELIRERLGKVTLKFGDLLLIQAPKESFIGLQTTRELLVLEEKNREGLRQDKALISLTIIMGVILISALDIIPILSASLTGVILMVITGCLKPGEIYGTVRWDIIFLLAGLIPLGVAMDNSGTNQWLVDKLLLVGGNLSGYWILVLLYFATSMLTEVLSNNAAVVLMIPIAVKIAESMGYDALSFMYVVTFAASNSYLAPIGYQTNTMVYAPGGYKFLDYTRLGLPLTITLTLIVPLLIMKIYGI
ncbi:MAG: SLC13 family permease [Cyanobacteria bacterium]|nr:SLC13 family permease [Cyanobacteria bacterium CG_2015-16_32_12]NCO78166.1 SLC13 family permease [Cyanobacteria bacterium CG_2015-22_32_23]NCQ04613.1 SLC13 family permease [Cyanobacteria bacterium CG_2015-09_32_10]NCQ43136.1 SLC13 family permease [Cyanobacteria bacterium CG_2015-04_32_10]NCS84157.1 SLC13 family permease [Cyanobacteria bacterium CG_2015-02_32_10]